MPQKPEPLTSVEETAHRQRRWGCTCGCLAFLVALIVGSLAIAYFALRPYPLVRPDRWLTSSTVGFGLCRFSSADSGTSDLINYFARRIQEKLGHDLQPRDQQALHSAITLARQSTDWIIYPSTFLYLERPRDQETKPHFAVVAQFRHFFGYLLFRMAVQSLGLSPQSQTPTELVFRLGGNEKEAALILVLAHTKFVVSDDAATAESFSRPEKAKGTPSERFMTYYGELNTDKAKAEEDLCFALVNENNAIGSFLEYLLATWKQQKTWQRIQDALAKHNVAFSDIQGVVVSLDIVSSDRLKCVAQFFVEQPTVLKRLGEAAKLLEGLTPPSAASTSGFAAKIETHLARNYVQVTVDCSGLRNIINLWMEGDTATSSTALTSVQTTGMSLSASSSQ
ncbi:MAG: hypothetical protein N2Z21_00735 [Candidatus Sumerlaeaceae bacterium]|nr:hypothetical protein [Candidatus Sumerlaeaceae bacterium]